MGSTFKPRLLGFLTGQHATKAGVCESAQGGPGPCQTGARGQLIYVHCPCVTTEDKPGQVCKPHDSTIVPLLHSVCKMTVHVCVCLCVSIELRAFSSNNNIRDGNTRLQFWWCARSTVVCWKNIKPWLDTVCKRGGATLKVSQDPCRLFTLLRNYVGNSACLSHVCVRLVSHFSANDISLASKLDIIFSEKPLIASQVTIKCLYNRQATARTKVSQWDECAPGFVFVRI